MVFHNFLINFRLEVYQLRHDKWHNSGHDAVVSDHFDFQFLAFIRFAV